MRAFNDIHLAQISSGCFTNQSNKKSQKKRQAYLIF